MKRWKIVAALFAAALMAGCSSSGPKDAVKNFSENMAKQIYEEAKKYCTERTNKLVDLYGALGGEAKPNYKFTFIKDSIVEKEAWVTYLDFEDDTTTVHVVNIDNKWLVDEAIGK